MLLESPSPHRAAAAWLLAEATRHLIRGQVLDVAFEQRHDVSLNECLDMVSGKTGALLKASSMIGAVLAGAPADVVNALSTFGAELGIAFLAYSPLGGIREASNLGTAASPFQQVADARGVSPQQVALAWVLAASPVAIPIPGSSRPQTLRDSVAAADLTLTPDELALLDA